MSTERKAVEARKVYVVFQGGGARGAVHVGALKALELAEFPPKDLSKPATRPEIVGVAGTSAGSIMAALVSAGYESDQILDLSGKSDHHVLKGLEGFSSGSLTGLFTERGWARIKKARWIAENTAILKFMAVDLLAGLVFALFAAPTLFALSLRATGFLVVFSVIVVLLVAGLVSFFKLCKLLREGLAPLDQVRDVIDEVLANSPIKDGISGGKDITFEELKNAGGKPLRIVATNLTKKTLQLFSVDTTPGISVASAVCASICLPLIFKPYPIRMPDGSINEFADGGVVSNLPLWAFDDERMFQPDCWTVGISLRSADSSSAASGHWLGAIIDAVVSGPPEIHARNIPGLVIVPAKTRLHLLDFDKSQKCYVDEAVNVVNESTIELYKAVATPFIELVVQRLGSLEDTIRSALIEADLPHDFTLKAAIATRRGDEILKLWPRFEVGYGPEEAAERRRPIARTVLRQDKVFVRQAERLGEQADDDLFTDTSVWPLADSLWCLAMPLVLAGDTTQPDPPVLVIESSSLTLDGICAIYGAGDLKSSFTSVIDSVKQILLAVDKDSKLIDSVRGAQLWK
ncbi:patatin-like phospholipase family protein [Stenotrophomonas maltophilia]|nr:patatin-like phospholipase family protein [Stenotrophomonas maltophilia]